VDISYGRLLFPALVAFAPLTAYGWTRFMGRVAPILVLPLAVYALIFPLTTLRDAYPQAQVVTQVPAEAIPINAPLENSALTLLAYSPETMTAAPYDAIRFTLYITQPDSRNPALFITVLDSVTLEALGTIATYPAMLPTDALASNQVYAVPLQITLDAATQILSPRLLKLQIGWQPPLETTYLPLIVNSQLRETVILNSALLLDPRYQALPPAVSTSVTFGEAIALEGYTLEGYASTTSQIEAGEALTLDLHWRTLRPPSPDGEWVATVQLLTLDWTTLITQDDGAIVGYPSAGWRAEVQITDTRSLAIPPDTPNGSYQLVVGWYRLSDFQRLQVNATGSRDHLYPLLSLDVTR
jgi:hypothetical protein